MAELLGQVFDDGGNRYIRHGADRECANEGIAVVAVLQR
jgi:hypothetical protein